MRIKLKLNFKTILNLFLVCLLVLPSLAMVGLADEGNVTILHSDGSTSTNNNVAYQEYTTSDDMANKIYSNNTILGFHMGSGSITDIVSVKHCMGVISANPIVFAIICVIFAIGITLCVLGFFWSTIMHGVRIVFASFDANADQAIAKMHQHRKGLVYTLESVGLFFMVMAMGIFALNFCGA